MQLLRLPVRVLVLVTLSACGSRSEAAPATPTTEGAPGDGRSGTRAEPAVFTVDAPDALDAGPALPDASAPPGDIAWPPATDGTVARMREARQRFERHAQCFSSSSCASLATTVAESGEVGYDNGAARCVLDSLRFNNAGFFRHRQVDKSGEGSSIETFILLHPTGIAEVTTHQVNVGGLREGYSAELCVLSSRAIEACLAELPTDHAVLPDAPACVSPRHWFTQCLGLDQTSLPDVTCR